ncbi:hypothetical protein [Corynebacterium yonathiae]|nr:hypothetical protein [Corynebacterium yonathiae]
MDLINDDSEGVYNFLHDAAEILGSSYAKFFDVIVGENEPL